MKVAAHPVAAEDLMALMDGELAADEARVVSAHAEECEECALLMREFRGVSEALAGWTVEDVSPVMDAAMNKAANAAGAEKQNGGRRRSWKAWALGGGGILTAAAVLLLAIGVVFFPTLSARKMRSNAYMNPEPDAATADRLTMTDQKAELPMPEGRSANSLVAMKPGVVAGTAIPSATRPLSGNGQKTDRYAGDNLASLGVNALQSPPMIARTVSVTMVVKDVPEARAGLERVLARYGGYAAQLTVNTPEGGARSFQASLRVPAAEVAAALSEVRGLGRVENESQAGEEVTQQHADLVARLQNSRETEQRLKDILAQRTGKIEDVLQVEEEIARVRGEIEGMEADQKTLEHRVDFASVDLQMSEVYREQLGTPSASVGTQVRNAFISGLRRAGAMMLGLVLFVEEAGPAVLIWVVILGAPGFVVWRRYRKIRAKI